MSPVASPARFDGSSVWAAKPNGGDFTATFCEEGVPASPDASEPIGWPGAPWMALSGGAGWMAIHGPVNVNGSRS